MNNSQIQKFSSHRTLKNVSLQLIEVRVDWKVSSYILYSILCQHGSFIYLWWISKICFSISFQIKFFDYFNCPFDLCSMWKYGRSDPNDYRNLNSFAAWTRPIAANNSCHWPNNAWDFLVFQNQVNYIYSFILYRKLLISWFELALSLYFCFIGTKKLF